MITALMSRRPRGRHRARRTGRKARMLRSLRRRARAPRLSAADTRTLTTFAAWNREDHAERVARVRAGLADLAAWRSPAGIQVSRSAATWSAMLLGQAVADAAYCGARQGAPAVTA